MGKVKEPLPVKLVVAMISGEESLFKQAEKKTYSKIWIG